ncbi:MAG: acyl-CoA dehydrogenase [Deltaproteobacteria bacterium]|nr:acyl-CoA dehydrogenase [Deltaproteobacteria bacterium]
MPTEFSVHKRDIQFVLYEQLNAEELCKLPDYGEFNRELFDMVTDEAVKMAVDVLAPLNSIGDREGLKFENGEVKMPEGFEEAFKKFGEGGWIGMVHNPEYGGQGLPNVLKFVAAEVFSGANIAFFLTSLLTEGAAHLVEKFGTDKLRKTYCEKLYSGVWTGTMCLTEPSAGSDVGNLKTTAKKDGDHYLVKGSKIFISSGEQDMVPNILHPVLARLEDAPAGTKGISLFAVPKFLVNSDGSLGDRNDMVCGNIEHKMGIKASPTCTLNFGDEGKCQGWLLGEENTGMRLMFQMMNEARLGVGIQGLGLAAAAYRSALGYAQERAQGTSLKAGKDPNGPRAMIIEHPDVRRMIIYMKSMVEGMRSMMYSVAKYIDLAEKSEDKDEQARYTHMVELLTPICKAYGSDFGFRVNETAIQVYGGYGYCQEYPVEQYCRDQKISSIYEGTNGIQAMDLLGRKIGGKKGLYFKEYLELLNGFVETHKDNSELGSLIIKFDQFKNTLVTTTMKLGETLGKDIELSLLKATPYLEMFGHVVIAFYLLEAAVVANKKLSEICEKEGALDAQARAELNKTNNEAAFYHGRVGSARFFVNNILPQVTSLSEIILDADKAALDVVYPE